MTRGGAIATHPLRGMAHRGRLAAVGLAARAGPRYRERVAALLVALAGLACKSHREPPAAGSAAPAAAIADAGAPDADLGACRAAAARAPGLPPAQRAAALIDGCRPCGDWQPLLMWNTLQSDGGPTRAAIEAAMYACHAFCTPSAKQRFFNTLDAARGQSTRGPWRHLGDMCKAEVSAVPDSRFMGAPYFALDRIARALGELGDPALLGALELPLPPLTVSGVGVELPEAAATARATGTAGAGPAAVTAEAGPAVLTVDAAQVLLGTLPRARLSATGLAVSGDYPGAQVALAGLAAALAAPDVAGHPVAVLAPRSLAAARIAEVVAAAGGHELRLAVAAPAPGGWALPVGLPIALIARPAGIPLALGRSPDAAIAAARAAPRTELARGAPAIAIDASATVDGLAALLAALAALDAPSAALVPAKP